MKTPIVVELVLELDRLGKLGSHTTLMVQRPRPEVLALAAEVAARVPAAWSAYGDHLAGGWVTANLGYPGGVNVALSVHGLDQPPGWEVSMAGHAGEPWIQAGNVLVDLYRAELARAANPVSSELRRIEQDLAAALLAADATVRKAS